ncbi:MAG: hypothetical protein Rpha_0745 [Candidatus Ruthia sp. Apha_13_S6]|nr:hypothetical protein [Candidatus Ruthia sp. Apha_13_S6]
MGKGSSSYQATMDKPTQNTALRLRTSAKLNTMVTNGQ